MVLDPLTDVELPGSITVLVRCELGAVLIPSDKLMVLADVGTVVIV